MGPMELSVAPTPARARTLLLRERESRSRKNRLARLDAMRATVAALERALPVMLTLDSDLQDDDERWKGFLDDQAVGVRRLLRKWLLLAKQADQLRASQARLRDLLHEHRLTSHVLAGMLQKNPVDDWDESVRRWRELARRHFRPWLREDCEAEIWAAQREVEAFQWGTDMLTTGASFFGWRDQRRVDAVRGVLQFQFHKTFRDDDVHQYVDRVWETYANARLFGDVIIGPRARSTHQVLQRIGKDIMIAMGTQRNPAIGMDVHMVFIVFRIKIQNVITLCVRSIDCPELIAAVEGPTDVWSSNCVWTQWELLAESEKVGYKFRTGGSIGGIDVNYANQWMWEVFGAVLRAERYAKGRSLITIS